MSEPIICIGMPSRDPWACRDSVLAMEHCVRNRTRVVDLCLPPCPLLDHCFNQYWAEALNQRDESGATHFAMIHNDVCPDFGWLTVLLDELTRLDADVVSATIPLKDNLGLTSTGVYDGSNPWKRRRLSLHEVANLPDTFCADDTGEALLLNTGLWVCDLSKEWCDDWHFQAESRIVRRNGRRVAEVLPEDWAFSHFLNQRGAKICATNKVRIRHVGDMAFPNGNPWGAWTTDEDAERLKLEAA